jgi:hypothetical protein
MLSFARHRATSRASDRATRRWIGVAVLALLMAQWTALGHALSHAPGRTAVLAQADDPHGWHHGAGASACQLVDQLLVGQATGGEPTALSFAPRGEHAAPVAPTPAAAQRALAAYEARGPPRA